MTPSLIDQGLTLMLVGMGTVFVFLTVLVGAMSALAIVVKRLSPLEESSDVSDEEVAAIAVAIARHRASRS